MRPHISLLTLLHLLPTKKRREENVRELHQFLRVLVGLLDVLTCGSTRRIHFTSCFSLLLCVCRVSEGLHHAGRRPQWDGPRRRVHLQVSDLQHLQSPWRQQRLDLPVLCCAVFCSASCTETRPASLSRRRFLASSTGGGAPSPWSTMAAGSTARRSAPPCSKCAR